MTLSVPRRYRSWMEQALDEARRAEERGEVPVGAVLVDGRGRALARAHNERELRSDPTAHAEILALRAAAAERGDWRLTDLTLVVTLEPCVMCAGAIVAARIPRLVFGAWDPRVGAAGSLYDVPRDRRLNHRVEVVGGVLERECQSLLDGFFAGRRKRLPGDDAVSPTS